jgi:hypothetical protein
MMLFHEQINETMLLITDAPGKFRRVEREKAESRDPPDLEWLDIISAEEDVIREFKDWFIKSSKVRPGMYHSKFPEPWKTWMVDWFRAGRLNVMLSVKALAQGFDMPGADEGIIRTSTSNVRQRIQTIGRLIRKKQEEGAYARIWIIYVKDTSDERIFAKHDWESELPDVQDVQTYWELEGEGIDSVPIRRGGAEMLPQPDRELTGEEIQAIDISDREFGDDYPEPRVSHNPLHECVLTRSGSPAIMDGGVPFKINHELIERSGRWLFEHKGTGRLLIISNGHIVAWSKTGRMVFLGQTDLESVQTSIDEALDESDDFESFLSGFER